MASQSLYRKWRSQTFGDLVGQEPVVRTLKNALNSGKLAHAYLFTGPRGTGKTSTARLLAKTINCTNSNNGEPCNLCEQCREITLGNSFNVIEIDAASNRGIDNIRELREKILVPPSSGIYKVYVLDEAHMLTTEACNALLKTLEEPPPYAIFVLATTDVHKMLPTILSRCQRFDFKRITTRQIVAHMHFVAGQEHVTLEQGAAELIARAAAGGMRDALSLLDQAIAYSGSTISLTQVQTMLGVADSAAIQKLITHVAHLDSSAALHLIHELTEAGAELRQINTQAAEYWRALMLARAGTDLAIILDRTDDELHEITQMSQLFDIEELIGCARIFAQNDLVQKNQGIPQLGLELAILACIEIHRRPQVPTAQKAQPSVTLPHLANPSPEKISSPDMPRTPPLASREKQEDHIPVDEKHSPTIQVTSTALHTTSEHPVSGHSSLTLQQVQDAWETVKKRVKQRDAKTWGMLSACRVIVVEGTMEETVVTIQASQTFPYTFLQENARYKVVEWALKVEFDQTCQVRVVPPGSPIGSSRANNGHSTMSGQQTTLMRVSQQTTHREGSTTRTTSPPPMPVEQESSLQSVPAVMPAVPILSAPIIGEERENVSADVGSIETLQERVSHNPVVQQVIKTFHAKIVKVDPKQ